MDKNADISVNFAGVKMRNPIGVAPLALCSRSAADPERYAKMLLNYVRLGAGYVYTPYTCNEREWPQDKRPTQRWLKSEWEMGKEGYFIF